MTEMRLQKFLARAGAASRRGAEALIVQGRVRVNGQVAAELGTKVDAARDEVLLDGEPVVLPAATVTIMLHKPAGYVSTMTDPQGRPTVADLVPTDEYPGLYNIGRLDLDTTGLLLFTNDGELGNALLHPRRHVVKRYVARIAGRLSKADAKRLRKGVELDDGWTLPAEVELLPDSCVAIGLREGRKRQVRRMLEHVGCPVSELHRSTFGPLELGELPEGSWRLLTDEEVVKLKAAAGDPDRVG